MFMWRAVAGWSSASFIGFIVDTLPQSCAFSVPSLQNTTVSSYLGAKGVSRKRGWEAFASVSAYRFAFRYFAAPFQGRQS